MVDSLLLPLCFPRLAMHEDRGNKNAEREWEKEAGAEVLKGTGIG